MWVELRMVTNAFSKSVPQDSSGKEGISEFSQQESKLLLSDY